jgi:putative ABC transport system permease protein
MKLGLYLRYSMRSLRREGQRTLLAIFCVAVGVMAIVALQLVGNMINSALTGNVRDGNGGDIQVRILSFNPILQSGLSADQVKAIFDPLLAKGEIAQYTAVSVHSVQSRNTNDKIKYYQLRAIDPTTFPLSGAPIFDTPGDGTFGSLLSGTDVVVTKTLLKNLDASVGDNIQVTSDDGRAFTTTIRGVIEDAGQFQRPQMLIALDAYGALRSSSALPVDYTSVYVNVPGHTDVNAATAKQYISDALGTVLGKERARATVTTTKHALQSQQNNVQNIRYFLQIVGLLALLIGGVGIMNTMQVLLRRRQTEIAMLKTAGYRQRDLFALFGLEAALLGLLGGAVGAGAGIGAGLGVRELAIKLFAISLPSEIDPATVASGVVIGFVTALIFGLMPIVQASQIRPLAVLRDLPEGSRVGSRLLTLFLTVVLAGLFFALALSILRNVNVALGAVIGTGAFLLLQSVFFGAIVFVITRIPVPEGLNLRSALSLALLVLFAAGFGALSWLLPPFAPLFISLAALLLLLVALPRTWKANVKLALRNIGRQRIRTITTMVALLIGVFGIGLILVLGQNIKDQVSAVLLQQGSPTALVLAFTPEDAQGVDAHLPQLPLIGPTVKNVTASGNTVSVDGRDFAEILNDSPMQSGSDQLGSDEIGRYFAGIEGFDLASGSAPDFAIVRGAQDTEKGRNLIPADAGTNNIIVPQRTSLAPLSLHLGSQIVQVGLDRKTTVTLTVVGFYDSTDPNAKTFTLSSILTDDAPANALSLGKPLFIYSVHMDPKQADQHLQELQTAVPGVYIFNLADLLLLVTNLLDNFLIMISSVMSLAVIAGLIIIANAVALAMLERRRELGILKATGFTSRSVLAEVLVEYGVVGFTGGLLAMVVVSVAMTLLGNLLLNTPLTVATTLALGIVLLTAVVCMLIAGFVAWGATRVRPLEVLRYE